MSEYIPTITGHHKDGGTLVLETLDPREETDLISTDEGLQRRGDLVTDEQQEILSLHEKN